MLSVLNIGAVAFLYVVSSILPPRRAVESVIVAGFKKNEG
jgi:hypothetical protein